MGDQTVCVLGHIQVLAVKFTSGLRVTFGWHDLLVESRERRNEQEDESAVFSLLPYCSLPTG